MAEIKTLVDDIYKLFTEDHTVDDKNLYHLSYKLVNVIKKRIDTSNKERQGRLRMSNAGKPCERQLWYEVNTPELAEPLPPEAHIKFLYGDILEEILLFLAVEAGHKVEGEQDELEINGVKGHRDAILDGATIDVKSASTYSFNKFKFGLSPNEDGFGYLDQLGQYNYAGQSDDKVTVKDKAYFLVIDKTLGHITLDEHKTSGKDYSEFIEHKKKIVSLQEPPKRAFMVEPDGKSGNMKLGFQCSYCPFKKTCWPSMRTFLYANGPRHLVTVKREPKDIYEVKK